MLQKVKSDVKGLKSTAQYREILLLITLVKFLIGSKHKNAESFVKSIKLSAFKL